MERGKVDLNTCEEGDILISALGAKLKYIGHTSWEYLDHKVQYLELPDGSKPKNSFGTRTNDGYVFKYNRISETDHDIIEIIKINK